MKRVIAVLWLLIALLSPSLAEHEYFVICNPDSFVNVRDAPKKGSQITGTLWIGDKVTADGHKRNGYQHVTGLTTESGDGWVYGGYLVADQPQVETVKAWVDAKGRVACRRGVNGERTRWLKSGQELTLYASSAEWSVTDKGFVQTEYILAER